MTSLFSPGVDWYADQVKSGEPFTLIRYGEGDFRVIVPTLTPKGEDPDFRGRKEYFESAVAWAEPVARAMFRDTFANLYDHPRYWVALWHLNVMKSTGRLERILSWLEEVGLSDHAWHNGRIWRTAVEDLTMGKMMDAMRTQPLPIVVVAPDRMRSIKKRLPVHTFIESPMPCGPDDVSPMVESILKVKNPCLLIFCASIVGKIAIHRLFPVIGEESAMIDFGANLDGICGNSPIGYHGPKCKGDRIVGLWGRTA